MKKLKLGISAVALVVASSAIAQTTTNPWLIGIGAHGENHIAQASNFSKTWTAKNLTKNLFSVGNYSITPPLSKLTIGRNLAKGWVLDLQASVGNVGNKRFGMDKEFFLMAGLGIQWKINGLWNEDSWFDPYFRVGANYLRHDYSKLAFPATDSKRGDVYKAFDSKESLGKANHFTVSTGFGLNVWLTNNFGLGVQGDWVTTPGDKSVVANFWQASGSLLFRFGNTDKDGDGIPDKDDRCPDTPGLPEFDGCPDTDGDGIPDIDDQCPDVPGPKENNGCPWPDTDGDGVLDKDDKCPNTPGPKENDGCPWPDRDGDGILDKDDKCPDVPGLPEYDGCPPTAEVVTAELKDILFDFDKATIQSASLNKVDNAAEIIKNAKEENFLVVGMTDAKGNPAYNKRLSQRRAQSVVNALVERGVKSSRLKAMGIGSDEATVPATASNEERQKDRKVILRSVSSEVEWKSLK